MWCPKDEKTEKINRKRALECRNGKNKTLTIHPSLMLLTINEFQALLSSITCLHSYPISSVQFSSVAQSCLTLCDPMNHSTPGLPVHHPTPQGESIFLTLPHPLYTCLIQSANDPQDPDPAPCALALKMD